MKKIASLLLLFAATFPATAQLCPVDSITVLKTSFPSADSLPVSAFEFRHKANEPWILLCHQARYSKGEYRETGMQLATMGYNCMAIDQRSGKQVNGEKNETAAAAEKANKSTGFLDAEQDILAALNRIYSESKQPVILVGSSYSAGLVLKIAATYPEKVKAVISFSPGEYFGDKLKVADYCAKLSVPVFMTASRNESTDLKTLFATVASKTKTIFVPVSEGSHGSKVLWPTSECRQEYWDALTAFLKGIR